VVQRNTLVKRHINISLVHLQFIQCIVGFGLSPARQNIKCSIDFSLKTSSTQGAYSERRICIWNHMFVYVCELCILQCEKKLRHLFFKCPFAKNCLERHWSDSAHLA
jgi:hypothetical protein